MLLRKRSLSGIQHRSGLSADVSLHCHRLLLLLWRCRQRFRRAVGRTAELYSPFFVVLASSSATADAISSAVLPLSQRALLRILPYFCSVLRRRTASCLCRLRGCCRGADLAADACLVASSFEADADDADTPPNWRTMRQPFLRILRWFPRFRVRLGCLRCGSRPRCCAACSVASPAFVVAVEADDAALLPIFRRRWHWLRPARHLLTRTGRRRSRCF